MNRPIKQRGRRSDLAESNCRVSRSGISLIVVVIVMTIASGISLSLVQLVTMSKFDSLQADKQAQVFLLAQDGLQRGLSQLQADAGWTGEVWTPRLPDGVQATVTLQVKRVGPRPIELTAQAVLPGTGSTPFRSHQSLKLIQPATASLTTTRSRP